MKSKVEKLDVDKLATVPIDLKILSEIDNDVVKKTRVWLNGPWFMIHNNVLNFLNWIVCYLEPFHDKIKK